MIEEKNTEQQETVIELKRLFHAIKRRFWLIVICALVCATTAFVSTTFFIAPQYQASSLYYLYNRHAYSGITANDLATAKTLVKTYSVILKTHGTIDVVIAEAGLEESYEQLCAMITTEAMDDTEILKITVTSKDPQKASTIAHAIEKVLPERVEEFVLGASIKVLDTAVTPWYPSSPSAGQNAVKGLVFGAVISMLVALALELANVRIQNENDITQLCRCPVLASVPYIEPTKGAQRKGRRKGKILTNISNSEKALLGANMSFAAQEAYKKLRTMLQFSFTDESSHVIAISSALSGEGKSTTSVNLAYSLALMNKKVILIDGDMRRPSIMSKLEIKRAPGLSNYLSGQNNFLDTVQKYKVDDQHSFDVVAAGRTPPNPIELLSSQKMNTTISVLRKNYDYVILDLPPAGEVSDAVAVGKMTDGLLLVVRENFCNRYALSDIMHQFGFTGTKLLGVVYNAAQTHEKVYGNYGRKYGDSK